MMPCTDPLYAFTETVLAYRMEGQHAPESPKALSMIERDRHVERTLRLLARSGKRGLLLFGLGAGDLVSTFAAALPHGVALTVCETDPEVARSTRDAGYLDWQSPIEGHQLLVEQSPWAHLCLLFGRTPVPPDCVTLLNPEIRDPAVRSSFQKLQRLLLGTRETLLSAAEPTPAEFANIPSPDLTVAAIVSPNEIDLGCWTAHFPDWVREVVLVWDAPELPEFLNKSLHCAAPIRQIAQPLDDFASQRNTMLAACSGSWVLTLDADEKLAPATWERLRILLSHSPEASHYHLPRATFHPDGQHCRAGYGLWPDLQLRLFRNEENLRYVNPIHERLEGLRGSGAILPDDPILHYSHLRKRPEELLAKLERFDQASGGTVRHRLTTDYPHLPLSLLHPALPAADVPIRQLRLPDATGTTA